MQNDLIEALTRCIADLTITPENAKDGACIRISVAERLLHIINELNAKQPETVILEGPEGERTTLTREQYEELKAQSYLTEVHSGPWEESKQPEQGTEGGCTSDQGNDLASATREDAVTSSGLGDR